MNVTIKIIGWILTLSPLIWFLIMLTIDGFDEDDDLIRWFKLCFGMTVWAIVCAMMI